MGVMVMLDRFLAGLFLFIPGAFFFYILVLAPIWIILIWKNVTMTFVLLPFWAVVFFVFCGICFTDGNTIRELWATFKGKTQLDGSPIEQAQN